MPASVTIMPEKEWPTRTVGPSCRASTRTAAATASANVVNGFCTEVAFSPAACNRAITSVQQEPSANRPCTSTTLRAFGGVAFAAIPRLEIIEAAAPAMRAVENSRLFIMVSLLSYTGTVGGYWIGAACCGGSIRFWQQGVDIRRAGNGAVVPEGLVVCLDAVVVVEVVDHDAEGFLDPARRGVAEPVDTLEPRAIAEVKTRNGVDAYRGLARQIAGAKPQQGRAQLLAPSRVIPPAVTFEFEQQRGIGIASIRKPLTQPTPQTRYWRQR